MSASELPQGIQFKLELLFEEIWYLYALGKSADEAFPNFNPYRFTENEIDLTGKGKAIDPSLMPIENGI